MASFGDELKRERELRDISLKEISEATKISIRFLEALEQNNFDILPGGIFNRGFIRAYARFIGVDGEEMVNAYLHEVSMRESRAAQGGRPARDAAHGAAPQAAPALSSGVYRPDSRPVLAGSRPEPEGDSWRESRVEIEPRSRRPSRVTPEMVEGRTSLALWVLVVLAVLVGIFVITMSLTGGGGGDLSANGLLQARRARLSKKAGGALPGQAALEPPSVQLPDNQAQSGPIASIAGAVEADTRASTNTDGTPVEPPASSLTRQQPEPAPTDAATAGPAAGSSPAAPPPPDHQVKVLAREATRVRVECAQALVLDQELWPGQSRTMTCAEPVVLSADNGGAIQYSIDGSPPALLGGVGMKVEGLVVAPLPAQEAPGTPGRGRSTEPGVAHAGT